MVAIPVSSVSDAERPPLHCGRAMWAVKNRATNELPYNAPIWWCRECGHHLPRQEETAA